MILATESFLARQQGGALLGGGAPGDFLSIKNINILYLSNPAFFVSLCSCVFHILSFLTPLPTFNSLPPEPLGGTMEKHMCTLVFIPLQKTRGAEGGGGNMARQRAPF